MRWLEYLRKTRERLENKENEEQGESKGGHNPEAESGVRATQRPMERVCQSEKCLELAIIIYTNTP